MKCVLVIDAALPLGLVANTAAVLAMSVANTVEDIIGDDVRDGDGGLHRGITRLPIPLLRGDADSIRALRHRLQQSETNELYWVDFCDVAQKATRYDRYRRQLADTAESDLTYLGIALCGPDKPVKRLTGSLPLLR